nr:MAG: putative RNA dependent RNA polymerase [Guangdong mito-like virus 3]
MTDNRNNKSIVKERNLRRKSRTTLFLNVVKDIYKYGWLLIWLLGNRDVRAEAMLLIDRIRLLYKSNGSLFTVMYLKESHRLIMKALAGQPQKCETPMRVATRRGLPLIIPGRLRLLIEDKVANPGVIRLVLSIITVYRVIRAKPVLKLSTITSPFTGIYSKVLMQELTSLHESRFSGFIPGIPEGFWIWKLRGFRFRQGGRLLPLLSAGPNVKVSLVGAILDAIAFSEEPNLLEAFKTVTEYTGKDLYTLYERESGHFSKFLSKCTVKGLLSNLKLGKLAEKLEPAGKVRVFAIADIWTQSALKPFHDYVFQILKNIPQDGTFDQYAPIRALMNKGFQDIYSYDLTAATDRLPIDLQKQIISLFMDERFAEAWATLLVGRPWYHKGVPLLYAVGQPMGAYSSWAMLALTHHYIVQLAARRSGWKMWFPNYAVLGDDIVIADKGVAKAYLSLMEDLGVGINLSKSLESNVGLAEFAKRLLDANTDYSAIGPKSVLQVIYDRNKLPTLFLDLKMKEDGEGRSPTEIESLFDSFPEELNLKGMKKNLLWSIIGPFGFIKGGLAPFLETNSLSQDDSKSLMDAFDHALNLLIIQEYYRMKAHNSKAYLEMIKGGKGEVYTDDGWVRLDKPSWFDRLPIEGLPSTDDIMKQISYKMFDTMRPYLVEWPNYIQSLTYEHMYDYIQSRIQDLENYIPIDNVYRYGDRQEPAAANRFVIYKLVAARLWQLDPAVALRIVRWDSRLPKEDEVSSDPNDKDSVMAAERNDS